MCCREDSIWISCADPWAQHGLNFDEMCLDGRQIGLDMLMSTPMTIMKWDLPRSATARGYGPPQVSSRKRMIRDSGRQFGCSGTPCSESCHECEIPTCKYASDISCLTVLS